MPAEKSVWRFKTKKEAIDTNSFGVGWNNSGEMDYLYGTFLDTEYTIYADEGVEFTIPNKNGKKDSGYKSWIIHPKYHLIKVTDKIMVKTSDSSTPRPDAQDTPIFDIDRLAKEIDVIFQEQLSISEAKYEAQASSITEGSLNKFEDLLEDTYQKYASEVDAIFPTIKDKLFEEFSKGRTTLVLPSKEEITVEHMDHPELESVMESLHYQRKAMLVGPAG